MAGVPLALGGGLTATLYVGQLDRLLRRLEGAVTFNTSSSFRWTGSAAVHVDGELVGVSADYRLTLEAVEGSVWTWRAGNDSTPVECRV